MGNILCGVKYKDSFLRREIITDVERVYRGLTLYEKLIMSRQTFETLSRGTRTPRERRERPGR